MALGFTLTSAATSTARPTQQDLRNAQAKLDQLNQRLELLVEQYDQATVRLQQVEGALRDARSEARQAATAAAEARRVLDSRAAAEYIQGGGQLDVLLGATTFADFSERLEFVDQLAQADHDAAIRAEVEGQRARDAAQRLRDVVAQRTRLLATIDRSKTAIRAAIAEQQAMVHSLKVL